MSGITGNPGAELIQKLFGIPPQHITIGTVATGLWSLATGQFGSFLTSLKTDTVVPTTAASGMSILESLGAGVVTSAVTAFEASLPADIMRIVPSIDAAEAQSLASLIQTDIIAPLLLALEGATNPPAVAAPTSVAGTPVVPAPAKAVVAKEKPGGVN